MLYLDVARGVLEVRGTRAAEASNPAGHELDRLGRGRRPSGCRRTVERGLEAFVEQQVATDIIGYDLRAGGVGRGIAAEDVVAVSPGEQIAVAAAFERVVARPAVEVVFADPAAQQIVAVVAQEDVCALAKRGVGQRRGHRRSRRAVIGPGTAEQRVVAAVAAQDVVELVAGNGIVELRPDDVLDSRQLVAFGLGTRLTDGGLRAARAQRHGYADGAVGGGAVGPDVADCVDPAIAAQIVGAQAADQHIVTVAALQYVRADPADQCVVPELARKHCSVADDQIIDRRGQRVGRTRQQHPVGVEAEVGETDRRAIGELQRLDRAVGAGQRAAAKVLDDDLAARDRRAVGRGVERDL